MFDPTIGPARTRIDAGEMERFRDSGVLFLNDNLRRPLWFDGRFLDARALTSEQHYFLARQAGIARSVGVGVTHGLWVDQPGSRPRAISISAGHGLTPAGDIVVLPEDLQLNLASIPEMQKLDASFGLLRIPREPPRNRTGLFIVALRPVEFSAEPIASYPTSITGKRAVEDGSIIEATAVTLIPYPDEGARIELRQRRSYVAHEIFIDGSSKGQPAGVLPLAMIALNMGVLEWIDPYLVRREVGAGRMGDLEFGLPPRARREAFFLQYRQQLADVLATRGSGSRRFPASDYFGALPPAGPMPTEAVDPSDFTQAYFPPEMDVDLSIIPEDELSALVEESMFLPPIDLTLTGDEYESTSVLIVVPVPRKEIPRLTQSLQTLTRQTRSTAPGILAKRRPIVALTELKLRRFRLPLPPVVSPIDNAWREVLQSAESLWYVRRRNVHYKAEVVATMPAALRDETAVEGAINDRLRAADVFTSFSNVKRRGTSAAEAEAFRLLSSPSFLSGSDTLIKAAVNELSSLDTVNRESVLRTSERFADPGFGEGVTRLELLNPELKEDPKVADTLVGSGKLPELDRLARTLPETELKVLSDEIVAAASSGTEPQTTKVASLITEKSSTMISSERIAGPTTSVR